MIDLSIHRLIDNGTVIPLKAQVPVTVFAVIMAYVHSMHELVVTFTNYEGTMFLPKMHNSS